MDLEPYGDGESKALVVMGGRGNALALRALALGAAAVGALAAGGIGIALGRALGKASSGAAVPPRDEPSAISIWDTEDRGSGSTMVWVTRVSTVVVEEWIGLPR